MRTRSCCWALVALLFGASVAWAQAPIVIDHTCTDISQIPPQWLEQAKLLTIHYGHTSHGSQVNSGALNLEDTDPTCSFAIRQAASPGLPPLEDPPALRLYSGTIGTTYVGPAEYWSTASARDNTRTIISSGEYSISMFSWCGEMSWQSETYVADYLATMSAFESEFPSVRFVLMTGHTDGSYETGNLHQRNEQIRQYAIANNMVLFDFADIECWDPDGAYYLDQGCNDNGDYDGGNWCMQWCAANPGSDLCAPCGCAHSQPLICNLKGRALWWMMARLAGWPGPDGLLGDMNCDGIVSAADIDPFVIALTGGQAAYEAQFPDCDFFDADTNSDGSVSAADIDGFVTLLTGDV
jgi:hypothetical protein